MFKPIKVLITDGEVSLVENSFFYDGQGQRVDTVKIYDEILKKPEAPSLEKPGEEPGSDEEGGESKEQADEPSKG